MIVLGKQVGEVWKIPRIPPRASPSEEYSEFPDFSSLFTQDYYKPEGNTAHALGPDRLVQSGIDPHVLGAHLLLGKLLNLLNIKTFGQIMHLN